jgi:hypothetical protein
MPAGTYLVVWTLAAAATVLSACAPSSSSSTPTLPAKIAFGETTYDFGHVDQGTKVRHIFTFRNAGGLDLTIDNVRPSCECTATVVPARVITAGADGTIEVEFDPATDAGRQARTIAVYSNDPAQPVTTLTLRGNVEADVYADPSRLYVGHLSRGQSATNEIRIAVAEHAAVRASSVEAAGKTIEATLLTAAPGTSSQRVRVATKPDAPLGRFDVSLVIHTDSRQQPTLTVPVTGVVDGDIVVSPAELTFGAITAGQPASLTLGLHNQGKSPVHVTTADVVPAIGHAQLRAVRDGQDYRLKVELSDLLPPGRLQGTVEIHTDDPEQSLIAVSVSGRVVEKK